MSLITTHVLDLYSGQPAAGIVVQLEALEGDHWSLLGSASTDNDGRAGSLLGPAAELVAGGTYRLTFATGAYFSARQCDTFYPEVQVIFRVAKASQHYHVPLLLSPFGYSTYRGS